LRRGPRVRSLIRARSFRRFLPIWTDALQPPERQELIDMAVAVASPGMEPTDAQAAVLKRLREGLLPR